MRTFWIALTFAFFLGILGQETESNLSNIILNLPIFFRVVMADTQASSDGGEYKDYCQYLANGTIVCSYVDFLPLAEGLSKTFKNVTCQDTTEGRYCYGARFLPPGIYEEREPGKYCIQEEEEDVCYILNRPSTSTTVASTSPTTKFISQRRRRRMDKKNHLIHFIDASLLRKWRV